VGSEHGEGLPDAVMQRLVESVARVVTQGLQATLRGASRGDIVETKDPAEGRDGLGHGRVVGLLLLGRLGKCLGGLIEGNSSSANSQSRRLQTRVEERSCWGP
jgi:hypothetical protein